MVNGVLASILPFSACIVNETIRSSQLQHLKQMGKRSHSATGVYILQESWEGGGIRLDFQDFLKIVS